MKVVVTPFHIVGSSGDFSNFAKKLKNHFLVNCFLFQKAGNLQQNIPFQLFIFYFSKWRKFTPKKKRSHCFPLIFFYGTFKSNFWT